MRNDKEEPDEVVIMGGERPLSDSNLQQTRPGIPVGTPAQHIYTHTAHVLKSPQTVVAAYSKINFPDQLLRRVVGFLGNFGSGKTEVAVNFAMQLGLASQDPDNQYSGPVKIVDLDIVNMYFRSREAVIPLEYAGVDVINPSGDQFWADLPIILPEVRGAIMQQSGSLILDVGGDDLGAKVLSHIVADIQRTDHALLMVVNAKRPFTSDLDGARKVFKELEFSSGLKITGLVSNTHLMQHTDEEIIREGYEFAKRMSAAAGVPLLMVAMESRYIEKFSETDLDVPILPLYRFMLPPWGETKE
ncbi:MAG TPA: cobalamin biosynthesis protein CbiA [bacterium]|jgi:hypothetical protein